MSDLDRWRSSEPPTSGPSKPPDDLFDPLATGIGVFTAIAIPVVVLGGPSTVVIVIGVVIAVIAGVVAAIWVDHRGGKVWRGPRL